MFRFSNLSIASNNWFCCIFWDSKCSTISFTGDWVGPDRLDFFCKKLMTTRSTFPHFQVVLRSRITVGSKNRDWIPDNLIKAFPSFSIINNGYSWYALSLTQLQFDIKAFFRIIPKSPKNDSSNCLASITRWLVQFWNKFKYTKK